MLPTLHTLQEWITTELLSTAALLQLGWILGTLSLSWFLARLLIRHMPILASTQGSGWLLPLRFALRDSVFPLISLSFLLIYMLLAEVTEWPVHISRAAISLLFAWVIIRFTTALIRTRKLARVTALLIWAVAALNIVGLLDRLLSLLDELAVTMGDTRLSLLTMMKGIVLLAALLWVAVAFARLIERQIHTIDRLAPSLQVLFSKLIYISLIIFAVLVGLNTIGIDLTALAVFSGALGVGVGFGLQKVVSNFISGIILLMDRSIKPGDVVAIGDTYGWVNTLGARHVSVITRDGKEHLIPNELLITEKVENWSYTNRNIRIRIPIGVSYKTDLHRTIDLIQKAAKQSERVLNSPAPRCLVRGFGDSAVDLELRVWINDPVNGIGNITSEILLDVWDMFHKEGIEIPFPQRDIHLVSVNEQVSAVLQKRQAQ